MQYIQKQIEIDTSGHTNEYWVVDFKTINLINLPIITVKMNGIRSYTDFTNGKHVSDSRLITTSSTDLELIGSIGYANIPKLYELLTTKQITETYYEEEIATDSGISDYLGTPYQVGDLIQVQKTRQVPAYPEFFGGDVIDVL